VKDLISSPGLYDDPVRRRLWLLAEALRCAPLDRAIELARAAEAFVIAPLPEMRKAIPAAPRLIVARTAEKQTAEAAADADPVAAGGPGATKHGLGLSAQDRERLLDRIARGGTNATLAEEFGLTLRQVQGVRMGAARQIASRREPGAEQTAATETAASPEDVVRYLRQQDDVVVPQEGGQFLVNARFRLGLDELVSRANRMRSRQRKPEFRLGNGRALGTTPSADTSRHPMFWPDESPHSPSGSRSV
jgi:hypothetical protein